MNTKILALSAVMVFLSTGALSAGTSTQWTDVMKNADADKDQKVTPSEIVNFKHEDVYVGFQPFMAAHFTLFDFNHDGYLSLDECREGMRNLGYSDQQVTREFRRDYFGFRGLMEQEMQKDSN